MSRDPFGGCCCAGCASAWPSAAASENEPRRRPPSRRARRAKPEPSLARPDGHAFTKPSQSELKQRLTPLEYEVTQNAATEPPFQNRFWNNHEPGLYVDVVTGEPLFSSTDKFDSGTGWPSFSKPVDPSRVRQPRGHDAGHDTH